MAVAQRTHAPAPPPESVHRLPPTRLVERVPFLLELARGRRVIDLGFVNEGRTTADVGLGTWLHARLAGVASALVGIDADEAGVAAAAAQGYEAWVADVEDASALADLGLEPADVVVAGELIEHLGRPGAFLEAVRPLVAPTGRLVVTTTNATALTSVLAGLAGLELVNADHVGWHSWRTGRTLLARHGWALEQVAYYPAPHFEAATGIERRHLVRVRAFNAYQRLARPLFRVRPSIADGIVLVARQA